MDTKSISKAIIEARSIEKAVSVGSFILMIEALLIVYFGFEWFGFNTWGFSFWLTLLLMFGALFVFPIIYVLFISLIWGWYGFYYPFYVVVEKYNTTLWEAIQVGGLMFLISIVIHFVLMLMAGAGGD